MAPGRWVAWAQQQGPYSLDLTVAALVSMVSALPWEHVSLAMQLRWGQFFTGVTAHRWHPIKHRDPTCGRVNAATGWPCVVGPRSHTSCDARCRCTCAMTRANWTHWWQSTRSGRWPAQASRDCSKAALHLTTASKHPHVPRVLLIAADLVDNYISLKRRGKPLKAKQVGQGSLRTCMFARPQAVAQRVLSLRGGQLDAASLSAPAAYLCCVRERRRRQALA